MKTSLGAPCSFLWVMNKAFHKTQFWSVMLVNEMQDLGEPSFPELRRNSIFVEVMIIVLLIIHCFISLQILWRHEINDCNIIYFIIVISSYVSTFLQCRNWKWIVTVCYNFNYPIQSTKLILSTIFLFFFFFSLFTFFLFCTNILLFRLY